MKRISWTYTHSLNSRSKTRRTKHGEYYGQIRHTARYFGPQLALVQFDGNKTTSKVPYDELVFELEWEYTRTGRRHYISDGKMYSTGKHWCLWEICSSAPYGEYQSKYGYDLYHKGKLLEHGNTVKELKQTVKEIEK